MESCVWLWEVLLERVGCRAWVRAWLTPPRLSVECSGCVAGPSRRPSRLSFQLEKKANFAFWQPALLVLEWSPSFPGDRTQLSLRSLPQNKGSLQVIKIFWAKV